MKGAQFAQLGFVVLASLAVYSFVSTVQDAEVRRSCSPLCAMRPNYADQNRLAPDFELESISGRKVRLSDYRGKVVLLNFWSKTCPPCLEEMPSLARLAQSLKKHPGIELLTVTTDESAEDAKDTLKSVLGGKPPFEVLIDPEAKVVGDRYGTKLYPETWFIDEKGVIRARFDGARDWSNVLTIDLAKSLRAPMACDIRFARGEAHGNHAEICEEFPSAG